MQLYYEQSYVRNLRGWAPDIKLNNEWQKNRIFSFKMIILNQFYIFSKKEHYKGRRG